MSCGQIALKNLGVKVKEYFAYEIKPSAIYATQLNFPNTIQLGDLNGFDADFFKDKQIDLILCGSPCQDMSFVNNNRCGVNGEKSILIYRCVDILKRVNPKHFLFENVGSMKKQDKSIFNSLLGVTPIAIDSRLVSAQKRNRLYWTNIKGVRPPTDRGIKLSDILETNPQPEETFTEKKRQFIARKRDRGLYVAVNGDKAQPVTARGYASWCTQYIEDENGVRDLTTLEYRRLQTIPDWYDFGTLSKAKITDLLGDGWTVDVIAHILSYIFERE